MRIYFTRTARRHKIGKAHVLFVMEHTTPTDQGLDPKGQPLVEWKGLDDRGVEIRIVAAIVDDGETLLVFHVQPTYGSNR